MTLAKRIIPCLDVKEGRTVKGVNFSSLKDAGDPVELAKMYVDGGADELVFLDISASKESKKIRLELVRKVASVLDIPFIIGGGISSIEDAKAILANGADKISVNTAAVQNPALISNLSEVFGAQCVVVAIDAKKSSSARDSSFTVLTYGGSIDSGVDLDLWVKEVETRGAGEILLTSFDRDGTKLGFDVGLTSLVSSKTALPVIASGGCGKMEHFAEIFSGKYPADAALAASVFHYGELGIREVKEYLSKLGIPVRL